MHWSIHVLFHVVGVILIVMGLGGLVAGGFDYVAMRDHLNALGGGVPQRVLATPESDPCAKDASGQRTAEDSTIGEQNDGIAETHLELNTRNRGDVAGQAAVIPKADPAVDELGGQHTAGVSTSWEEDDRVAETAPQPAEK